MMYILNRLLYGLLVVWGVITVVFFIFHVLPGDPIASAPRADPEQLEAIKRELGLNEPIFIQYLYYLNDVSVVSVYKSEKGNARNYAYISHFQIDKYDITLKKPYLKRSWRSWKPVGEILSEALPETLWLAFASMLFATVLGIGLGLVSAMRPNTLLDNLMLVFSVIGISVPSFVAAILISVFFGYILQDWTGLNMGGTLWEDHATLGRQLEIKNIILPAFTLGIRPLAIIAQLTRNSMLEVLSQDYIRTARAKGLSQAYVVLKHALRNALNPVITAVSGWLASLITGAFFIEYIFRWKGLGWATIEAVHHNDMPVVMGTTILMASTFVLINITVDIFYSWVDPRVRLE